MGCDMEPGLQGVHRGVEKRGEERRGEERSGQETREEIKNAEKECFVLVVSFLHIVLNRVAHLLSSITKQPLFLHSPVSPIPTGNR